MLLQVKGIQDSVRLRCDFCGHARIKQMFSFGTSRVARSSCVLFSPVGAHATIARSAFVGAKEGRAREGD